MFPNGRAAHIVTGNGLAAKERCCTLRTRGASLVYDDHAPQKLLCRDDLNVRIIPVDPERPLTRALRLAILVVATLASVDRQLAVVAPRHPLPTEMR